MKPLKNAGSSAPLNQTICKEHNSYWSSYWENCGNAIDANLLVGKSKEEKKKNNSL